MRGMLAGVIIYGSSFVAAVLIVFFLNYIFQGHFSIIPAPWREATPLFSSGTLRGNLLRYSHIFVEAKPFWPAFAAAAFGYVLCFYREINTSQCAAVLLFGATLLGMDATLSVISGLALPIRSCIWLWGLLSVPAIFLLTHNRLKVIGALLSLILLLTGLSTWATQFQNIRTIFPAMRHLGQEILEVSSINVGRYDEIVIYGDPSTNPSMRFIHSNRMLRNFLFKEFHIYSKTCEPDLCQNIRAVISKGMTTTPLIFLDGKLVVVLSPEPGNLY
jgi:hypothetical protein